MTERSEGMPGERAPASRPAMGSGRPSGSFLATGDPRAAHPRAAPEQALTKVLLVSGPNLNLLGDREPEIYGTATLDDHVAVFTAELGDGYEVEHVQSNHEGALVDAIQAVRTSAAAIVINAGAFTHYSWAIHDVLATFGGPVIEVHLSNPGAREQWRHTSVITPVATGVIAGFGGAGYLLAALALKELLP